MVGVAVVVGVAVGIVVGVGVVVAVGVGVGVVVVVGIVVAVVVGIAGWVAGWVAVWVGVRVVVWVAVAVVVVVAVGVNIMALDKDTLAKLAQWTALKGRIAAECAPLVAEEMTLRKELFTLLFPSPVEGTNTADIEAGWKVKGTYKLDRKLDAAALPAVLEELRKQDVVADALIKYVPELNTKDYKALNADNRKIFEQAMTIKPASPTLELIPPKEAK